MFARKNGMALGQGIDTYLASLMAANRSKATVRTYRNILGRLSKRLGPTQRVQEISPADLAHYLAALREGTLSPAYISLCGRVIKSFFGWLTEARVIKANPMAAITPRSPAWNPVPPYSEDELRLLIGAAITPIERAAIVLLVDTGMRASELVDLRLTDLDLGQGLLRVHGKGGKVRTLALNDQPKRELEAYLASTTVADGCLWPKGFNYQTVHYLVGHVGRRAGVPGVHPHRFRHTFAVRFLAETGNALALQSLLGHTSLTMVQRYIASAQAELAVVAHKEHSPTARL